MRLCVLCAAAMLGVWSCDTRGVLVWPEPSLERMVRQGRGDAYAPSDVFADGAAMQAPPLGTVPVDSAEDDAWLSHGTRDEAYATAAPMPLSVDLLTLGQSNFGVFCAPCHGVAGDGNSVVARHMSLVKPPSLHTPARRAYPIGRIFRVIREGFGVMPDYRTQMDLTDSWAVAAYVKALQLSQYAPLDSLPPDEARRAHGALP